MAGRKIYSLEWLTEGPTTEFRAGPRLVASATYVGRTGQGLQMWQFEPAESTYGIFGPQTYNSQDTCEWMALALAQHLSDLGELP